MTSIRFPARRTGASLLLLLAIPALGGCSDGSALHPGDAAVVSGERIGLTEVDDLALATCALEERGLAQQGAGVPMSFVRSLAVETLITDVLIEDFATEHDVDLAEVRSGVREEAEKAITDLPDSQQATALDRLALEGVRRAVLQIVGATVPGGDASPDAASAAGRAVFAEFRKDADLVRDPRFGDVDLDTFQFSGASGSLSVAAEPSGNAMDQAAVAELPAAQRCGTPAPPQQ
ncbi:hypothetical protein [Nocardioides cavernaquae]|uniref:SurA N-terminal domain-containing protein n=1 Tax=Nocardioides cavernaquae TaxID=2321396 RepID=A0A3A5HB90_9ACTN|nr:hypothetical protein [Nocardioides cavernaquae]RJS45300.1 hypothetical protein D4739_03085 [Nocardioides cavernaquae]